MFQMKHKSLSLAAFQRLSNVLGPDSKQLSP